MEIVTYCSKNYEKVLEKMLPSWLALGSRVVVYTDSGLELNVEQIRIGPQESGWRANTIRKIEAIGKHAEADVDFTFLDSDCFVGERFEEVFNEDFSFGITGDEFSINSGVIFIKRSKENRKLISEWLSRAAADGHSHSEQNSLSELYKERRFSIKMFPKSKYNCYVGFKTPFCEESDAKDWLRLVRSKPKIIHFQGAGHFPRFRNLQSLMRIYQRNAKELI